jgi:hypothetical protein
MHREVSGWCIRFNSLIINKQINVENKERRHPLSIRCIKHPVTSLGNRYIIEEHASFISIQKSSMGHPSKRAHPKTSSPILNVSVTMFKQDLF